MLQRPSGSPTECTDPLVSAGLYATLLQMLAQSPADTRRWQEQGGAAPASSSLFSSSASDRHSSASMAAATAALRLRARRWRGASSDRAALCLGAGAAGWGLA